MCNMKKGTVTTVDEKHKSLAMRCNVCNKKVGLTVFPCRCGLTFCTAHSFSTSHACAFDYKGLGKTEIEKSNPLVVPAKLSTA